MLTHRHTYIQLNPVQIGKISHVLIACVASQCEDMSAESVADELERDRLRFIHAYAKK
jgi:hypothetical protein